MRWIAALALVVVTGCSRVRFHVTDFTPDVDVQSYGTTYVYRGNVLALGSSAVGDNIYEVVLRVTRKTGGDPATIGRETNPSYLPVIVANGKGSFSLFGGTRASSETWEPPLYEVTIVGYREFTPGAGR